MNGAENQSGVPTIPGPYLSPQQTETSPLKQNLINKRNKCLDFCWNWQYSPEYTGSLKTIIVVLFGTSAAITLALLAQIYYGESQVEPHGSVVTDNYDCSRIGTNILKNGGNAVDAAIASTMCLGVVNFHVTGLGGGGYMMIYNHRKHKMVDILDFREMSPNSYADNKFDTSIVGLTIGVPGFLKGLWEAHEKYGKLPWRDLIVPSVALARDGFPVSDSLNASESHLDKRSGHNLELIKLLNSMQPGVNVRVPGLYETLLVISNKGIQEFYNGSIAEQIVYSVKLAEGNMTLDDISQYQTVKSNQIKTSFNGFTILTSESSSGGALLLNCLNHIEILDLNPELDSEEEIILKMSDVIHDHYLSFLSKDQEHQVDIPEPAAAAVSVVDVDDNYVVVVTGLNTWLGSQILTESGFILNNAIANGNVDHHRRPVSLSTPVIAVQSGEVCGRRLILGSSDATAAAQLLTDLLIFKKNTSEAVESPRFNIERVPRHIDVEVNHLPSFSSEVLENLNKNYSLVVNGLLGPYKSINVIEKISDFMASFADSRGGGAPSQYR